jgi:hypothetical protein
MKATTGNADALCDNLVADLSDAAFAVAAHHGLQGSSVDQELALWHALGRAARKPAPPRREDFVGRLTEAAYQVALRQGFHGSFVDLELDLWRTLGNVVKQSRLKRDCSQSSSDRRESLLTVARAN